MAIANQIFKLIEDHAKLVGSAVQEFVKEHLEPMIEAIVKIVHDWIGSNPSRPVGTGHEVQEFVIELLEKVSELDLPGPAGNLLRLLRGALQLL